MVDDRLQLSSVNTTKGAARKAPPKPSGNDEVRAAILAAASAHFARHGMSASLRDIAGDARVNLGLIHRHFGNKDDLIRAVLESHANAGVGLASRSPDLPAAMEEIFRRSAENGGYIKTLAWLLLEDATIEQFQTQFPTIKTLREFATSDEQHLHLLAAFALLYGWTVFGDQLLNAFGHKPTDRPEVEQRLANLAGQLVSP